MMGLLIKIFSNNSQAAIQLQELLMIILIIIIITPPALPSQLSIKTSDSSIVEDPKGHDRKKNPISNYPVGAEMLSL